MADNRSRREKLEAVANAPSASEGERRNARAILERMGPKPQQTQDPPRKRRVKNTPPSPWSTTGRPLSWEDIRRAWDDLVRESVRSDDLFRAFSAAYPSHEVRTRRDQQSQLCKRLGKHDYVVISRSMYHTDIRRCVRCGEYDPPRR